MEVNKAKLETEKGKSFYPNIVRQEVIKSIKKSMSTRLRPYPESWDKYDRTGDKFINKYMKSLKPEQKKNVKELLVLWENRMNLLDNTVRDTYLDYYAF